MPLTDVRIRQSKPQEKPYRLADGGGLFLEVRPNGSKLWRYAYRLAGKPNLYALGAYPEMTLQEARAEHLRARELVRQGSNPSHERARARDAKALAGRDTFKHLAEDWIAAKSPGWSPYYAQQVRRYLEGDVYPKIGRLPARAVTAAEVLAILRTIAERGASAAILTRNIVSQVYAYGIANLRADNSPAYALRGAITRPPTKHAEAKTRDEVADVLARVRRYGGNRTTAIAVNLLLYCFVRTAEIRGALWSEIDFDKRLWIIPAARMKKRRIHIVPLSNQVVALLEELRTITGANQFLFPNNRDPSITMSKMTVNRALEYMGFAAGVITGHDFRATASTRLHELGYRSEWVELQLAHAKTDKVAAAYNHAEYLPERTTMMQAWADWVDKAADDVEARQQREAA